MCPHHSAQNKVAMVRQYIHSMFGGITSHHISSRHNFNKSTNKTIYGTNGGYTVSGGNNDDNDWSSAPTIQGGSANSLIRCGAVWRRRPLFNVVHGRSFREKRPLRPLPSSSWRGRLRYDRKRYRRRHRQKQNVVKNEFSLIGLGQINVIRDGMGWDEIKWDEMG